MNVWEGVDPFEEARRFSSLWGVAGTVLVDEEGAFVEALGIRGVPTNVLVDSDGTVMAVGAVAPDDLEAAVRRLLGPGALIDPQQARDGWHGEKDADHIQRHVALWDGPPV